MSQYETNKEDLSIPADGVSLEEVERDIQDLQAYITSLKSAEEPVSGDFAATKIVRPLKPRRRKQYVSENFEPVREKDDLLLMDFPQANNQPDDVRDTLIQDYIKDLATMNADEVLESRILHNGNRIDRRKQITLLPDDMRHWGHGQLSDTGATFEYPEHIVQRSDNKMQRTKHVESASKTQSHASHLRPAAGKRHRYKHINVQHERHPESPDTKNVNGTRILTEKTVTTPRENPTLKMSRKHGQSKKNGDTSSRKRQKSNLNRLTVISGKEIQETQNGDTNHTALIRAVDEINNSNQKLSRMDYRQNAILLPKHKPVKTESVEDVDALTTYRPVKNRNTVSIEKRRGRKYGKKKTYSGSHPNPNRPPKRPNPPPATTTVTTTTTTTIPTTVTTESSTWTTPGTTNRTMQEIIDSGLDKIDVPLSGAPAWHALIHGRRDIVLAGAIMGSIGLLLIIISVVYMFVSKRRSQQKLSGTAKANTNKNYQRFGSAEETKRLTEPEHSLFPLSSDEETTEESDDDSGRHLTDERKATVR